MSVKQELTYEINLPVVIHDIWLNNGKANLQEYLHSKCSNAGSQFNYESLFQHFGHIKPWQNDESHPVRVSCDW